MTGQLRSTLHTRADGLDTWDVDLDTIVRAGTRRVRRRRAALAGGVAVMVVGAVTALAVRGSTSGPQPADPHAMPLTYAVGTAIHSGDGSIDVRHQVSSFVRTDWGYVFSTPDDRVFSEKDGDVHEVGHLAPQAELIASDDGLVTAWWDGERIQTWPGYRPAASGEADAFDRTDSFSSDAAWSNDDPPGVEALSDGHMWLWDGRKTWIAEVRPTPSSATWPDRPLDGSDKVQDAAGGTVLVRIGDGMAVVKANLRPLDADLLSAWQPGTDLSGVRPQVPDVATGDLSPDGDHWFTADGNDRDEFEVFDSDTGQAQAPTYPGGQVTPYAWLGDDTIAAWTVPTDDPNGPVTLLTCQVSTNTCTVAASDIGTFGEIAISGLPTR